MKLIIAGGRDFDDYHLLEKEVAYFITDHLKAKSVEIVSGGAKGADKLAEYYAWQYKMKIHIFNADWQNHGKSAGPIRNEDMAKFSDACIVFWDGKSRGSANMINVAKRRGLQLKIVRYD